MKQAPMTPTPDKPAGEACPQCGAPLFGRCRLPADSGCGGNTPRTPPPSALDDEVVAILERFAQAHGTVASVDTEDPRWPDYSTLDCDDNMGFAESLTVGDLRRVRALLTRLKNSSK